VLHILFKRGSLLLGVRRVVKPQNYIDVLEAPGIQVIPIRRRRKLKVIFLRRVGEESQGLLGELNMVVLHIG
jgi:hypothetical protein